MADVSKLLTFIATVKQSLEDKTFVQITLSSNKKNESTLKNIIAKRIFIKEIEKLSFTYRHKTQDIVKNFDAEEAIEKFSEALQNDFKNAMLFTTDFDLQYQEINAEKIVLKKLPATKNEAPSLKHNKEKNRLISAAEKKYLTDLKITDAAGNVYKNAQDKYRQINHYIEILSSLIKEIPEQNNLKVVDMGAGKGYLTFALYDYLTTVAKRPATIAGVEFRKDLVELCNKIAENSSFHNLHFEEGTIESFNASGTNILIALHACDTATDDAISKGIEAGAELIVVAPCCHKQIRREIEKSKAKNELDFLVKHGIFLERQAEMVTDGIRALVLEYFGYKTKVFEFVSDVHTPKNVMIVGIKNTYVKTPNDSILQKINDTKKYFGIGHHYLEKIFHKQ